MVEASSKSGALITVDFALNQGRDVYIAPYDEKLKEYYGNHKLYKDGAKIAYNILDILEDFDDIFSNDEDYVKMKLKYFEGGNINKTTEVKKVNDLKKNNKVLKQEKKLDNKKQNKKASIIKPDLQDDEAFIYDIISKVEKIHIDDIIEKTNMKVQSVTSLLMQLEINGFIKQLSGKYYSIEK